jgi:single-strand DNA-binding protein
MYMATSRKPGAELFIRTSGYSYPDWKGIVYPRSVKRDVGGSTPELTYLSRYFNTCEINATFYRHFEPEIARKWSDAVESPMFEFAIKANQVFTHSAGTKPSERKAPTSVESLKYTRADIDQTRSFLDVLAERNRLLVVLFQFPVSFKFAKKDKEGEPIRLEGNWDHVADMLNAFKESWKNDKGDYENRTEWHRVFAWRNLSKFAKTLQKGQLVTLEGILRYREGDEVKGTTFKHRIAEVHATSLKRLSKAEAADDPTDGADDE